MWGAFFWCVACAAEAVHARMILPNECIGVPKKIV
jgi:hypothetical protein